MVDQASWGVTLDDIGLGWGSKTIVEKLNLSIRLKEWNYRVPIVGLSGCGKSTLLYAFCGLMRNKQGTVSWTLPEGKVARWSDNRNVSGDVGDLTREELRYGDFSLAFQDSALLSHLTVRENLRYPLEIRAARSATSMPDDAAILAMLKKVLRPEEDAQAIFASHPDQLSGGQRRRVALAQAMVTEPNVLFLDEPAGGLDPETKRSVMNVVDDWVSTDVGGKAVFWVTHHLDREEFRNCRKVLRFLHQTPVDQANAVKIVEDTPENVIIH